MLCIGSILSAGCRPDEQIHSYTVPVMHAPASTAVEPTSGEATDRMLAAILPQGDRAWFFKVVGPIAAVDGQEQAIDNFFASLRPGDDQAQPQWTLPDGWTEEAGTGMRAATIAIPTTSQPLELTVVALPWSGGPGDVLSNVNRWRGQMQLPAIDQQGLAECTHERSTDGTTVTMADLRGRMQSTGMSAPFAGGLMSSGGPPASSPSQVASPLPHAAESGLPKFDVPSGWQEIPAAPPRKAAFEVSDGSQEALVTLIDFPAAAGPMIADALPNLNRWRREIGLPEISAADLTNYTESIQVDGLPADYFEVVPDAQKPAESKIERATLAVMIPQGQRIWFFKIAGDRDLVAAERKDFRALIDSVRFSDGEGANDGN